MRTNKNKKDLQKALEELKNKNVSVLTWISVFFIIVLFIIFALSLSYAIGYLLGMGISALFGLKMVGSMITPQFFGLLFVIIAIVKG